MGCGKGLALHSGYNPPHLVWPNCGWLWHHNLTTKPATFLVGLWCKCGGGYHNVPRVGPHPRHTSATHRPHSVVEVWRDRINRAIYKVTKAASKHGSTGSGATHGPFEHASATENKLHAMTDEQLEADIEQQLEGLQGDEAEAVPKSNRRHRIRYQGTCEFSQPQGRRAAVLAGLRQRLERRSHQAGAVR